MLLKLLVDPFTADADRRIEVGWNLRVRGIHRTDFEPVSASPDPHLPALAEVAIAEDEAEFHRLSGLTSEGLLGIDEPGQPELRTLFRVDPRQRSVRGGL